MKSITTVFVTPSGLTRQEEFVIDGQPIPENSTLWNVFLKVVQESLANKKIIQLKLDLFLEDNHGN